METEDRSCGLSMQIGEPVGIREDTGSTLKLTFLCKDCNILVEKTRTFGMPSARLEYYLNIKTSVLNQMLEADRVKGFFDLCPRFKELYKNKS